MLLHIRIAVPGELAAGALLPDIAAEGVGIFAGYCEGEVVRPVNRDAIPHGAAAQRNLRDVQVTEGIQDKFHRFAFFRPDAVYPGPEADFISAGVVEGNGSAFAGYGAAGICTDLIFAGDRVISDIGICHLFRSGDRIVHCFIRIIRLGGINDDGRAGGNAVSFQDKAVYRGFTVSYGRIRILKEIMGKGSDPNLVFTGFGCVQTGNAEGDFIRTGNPELTPIVRNAVRIEHVDIAVHGSFRHDDRTGNIGSGHAACRDFPEFRRGQAVGENHEICGCDAPGTDAAVFHVRPERQVIMAGDKIGGCRSGNGCGFRLEGAVPCLDECRWNQILSVFPEQMDVLIRFRVIPAD